MNVSFDALRPLVDAALAKALPAGAPYSKILQEAMAYSLNARGKRLRPCMCLYAAQLMGLPVDAVMPFACALEMIHAYSLIHDDLPCMDDDDLRRGRPTNHKVYGEATALLAGDALLNRAFETMAGAVSRADAPEMQARGAKAMAYIAACAGDRGMIAGQVADMTDMLRLDPQTDRGDLLRYIEETKTGALIRAALVSGLILGGAPDEMIADFERFALAFGMVFQITDDLLDELGDEKTFGKPIHSDVQNHKLTAVTLYGIDGARALLGQYLETGRQALAPYPQAAGLLALLEAQPDRVV